MGIVGVVVSACAWLLAEMLLQSPLAFALHYWGVMPLHMAVYFVMVASIAFISVGVSLLAVAWATVHGGRDALVTSGIYPYLRHPQYLGLILIVLGFNIQWPALPTILMAPILVVTYVWLARGEDQELASVFGDDYVEYADRTPAFLPGARGRRIQEKDRASPPRTIAVTEHATRERHASH